MIRNDHLKGEPVICSGRHLLHCRNCPQHHQCCGKVMSVKAKLCQEVTKHTVCANQEYLHAKSVELKISGLS